MVRSPCQPCLSHLTPHHIMPQVAPEALRKAIDDFMEEVSSFAQELDTDVIKRAEDVKSEMEKIVVACS